MTCQGYYQGIPDINKLLYILLPDTSQISLFGKVCKGETQPDLHRIVSNTFVSLHDRSETSSISGGSSFHRPLICSYSCGLISVESSGITAFGMWFVCCATNVGLEQEEQLIVAGHLDFSSTGSFNSGTSNISQNALPFSTVTLVLLGTAISAANNNR